MTRPESIRIAAFNRKPVELVVDRRCLGSSSRNVVVGIKYLIVNLVLLIISLAIPVFGRADSIDILERRIGVAPAWAAMHEDNIERQGEMLMKTLRRGLVGGWKVLDFTLGGGEAVFPRSTELIMGLNSAIKAVQGCNPTDGLIKSSEIGASLKAATRDYLYE